MVRRIVSIPVPDLTHKREIFSVGGDVSTGLVLWRSLLEMLIGVGCACVRSYGWVYAYVWVSLIVLCFAKKKVRTIWINKQSRCLSIVSSDRVSISQTPRSAIKITHCFLVPLPLRPYPYLHTPTSSSLQTCRWPPTTPCPLQCQCSHASCMTATGLPGCSTSFKIRF
jgi:hypothetical protein